MRLANIGAGGCRPQDEFWYNIDNLRSQLKEGTPERHNLDLEPRYTDCDVRHGLPFPDNYFDGCCMVHVLEHLPCHDAVNLLKECQRVTVPGGYIVASVPDCDYFLSVYDSDTKDAAVELFGEPIHDEGHDKFFTYALFRHDHCQVLNLSSLHCLFLKAGFTQIIDWNHWPVPDIDDKPPPAIIEINKIMNRRKFSAEMVGIK